MDNRFSNPDNDPRGSWSSGDLTSKTKAKGHSYEIISPNGTVFLPPEGRQWAPAYETFQNLLKDNRIWFGETGDRVPRQKQFLSEVQNGIVPISLIPHAKGGHNQEAKKELNFLLPDIKGEFETPKPTKLIQHLMLLATSSNDSDIILDFFSGSATTAHAVMQLNAEDGGNRKFIMVQIPETIDEKHEAYKAGYRTICEIGKERIRRAGKKINEAIDEENSQIKLGEEPKKAVDVGFRVLKVDNTNMKDVYYEPEEITQAMLDGTVDNIKPDRTPEDLLFQVMLDLGVLLSCKIEKEVIGGKNVFTVYNGGECYLIARFDTGVTAEVVTAIAKRKPYYAVFRDSGMASDSLMTSFEQIFEAYSKTTVRRVL